ncbi:MULTISPECIES: helix-turn-helix domain-containing protein [unclassified Bifidobacterium]|uniref:helix-turn-helix domain-containing protein n=1 Tax=unclassified Bifidobacterium TaxID=2608897 RepID=UPI003F93305C
MFSPEERKRAVEPCLATSMIAAEVVERLGYPTRQCLERWLAKDPRHAGHMRSPIIPMETGQKAIELVLGGMRQKQAARQLGVSVGTVAHWVKAYREGGMAALPTRNGNAAQDGGALSRPRRDGLPGDDGDVEALRRRVEELELENALMREVADAFAASKGRYGYRGIKAELRTGVSEKVTGRIMVEDGLVAHVPGRRRYGSHGGRDDSPWEPDCPRTSPQNVPTRSG